MKNASGSCLVMLVCAMSIGGAQAAEAPPQRNVEVTITVKGSTDESYRVVVAEGRDLRTFNVGVRVPLPTAPADKEGTVAALTWQNVGVTARLAASRVPDSAEILLRGELSCSTLAKGGRPDAPITTSISQDLDVILQPGKTVRTAVVSGPSPMAVEITADWLDRSSR